MICLQFHRIHTTKKKSSGQQCWRFIVVVGFLYWSTCPELLTTLGSCATWRPTGTEDSQYGQHTWLSHGLRTELSARLNLSHAIRMRNSEVVVSVFLIIGAVCFAQWQRHTPTPQAKFVELRPGLYRLNFSWELHVAAPIPVAVWLVESSPNSWILIDGGTANAKNQRAILDGIQTTLSSAEDTLRLVLVTHGHPDHTGVLGKLLNLYPSIKVAYHEKEEPFLSGGKSYASVAGDNLQFNILKRLSPSVNSTLIPSSRALLLQGQSGDVSDVFTYADWLPKGVLEYHAVPGHTPGQVAFYHKSTGSVIAADSFTHISAWWPFSNVKGISLGSPPFSNSVEMVKGSQQNLAVLPGTRTFFPSHDAGNGISAKAIKEFVMA